MIALITAVVSMVVAITAAVVVVACRREMDEGHRQSWISALVVGTLATVLTVCLNHEVVRPALTCLAYALAISGVAIVSKVTGIAALVRTTVVRRRRQRQGQNLPPDVSLPRNSSAEPPRQSSDPDSPNSQRDMDATSSGGAT